MYRTYENPRTLEDALADAKERYEAMKWDANADLDDLRELKEEIEDLRQRVNFAWQDDEFY